MPAVSTGSGKPSRKNTPGAPACCGSGGAGLPLCGCSSLATMLKVDVPALGLTAVPISYSGSFGAWTGCQNVSVLGFAICATSPPTCSLATISAGFNFDLRCSVISGVATWTLSISYLAYYFNSCAVPSSVPNQSRALDQVCGMPPCAAGPSANPFTAYWRTPVNCTRPTSTSFSGSPSLILGTGAATPTNLYFGTSGATVYE